VLAGVVAGALVPGVRGRVADTVTAGLGDRSLGIRADLYESLLPQALLDPVGSGFGAVGVGARAATGIDPATDSTLLDVLLVFGGPAGAVVLAVLVVALLRMQRLGGGDGRAPAAWAVLVGLVAVSPLTNVVEGAAGVLTWSLALLAVEVANREVRV
jgi:hypothetical protein